jgi:hypothetical protein
LTIERGRKPWYKSCVVDAEKYRYNAVTTAILMDAGIALMRQNIRRRHPGETEAGIDALLRAWLHRANDPIPGDTSGSVRARERVP